MTVVAAREPRVACLVATFHPRIGGVQRVTEAVSRELVAGGVDTVVLTRRYPGLEPTDTVAGVPVRRLGIPGAGKLGALSYALHALWLLGTRMRSFRVVHAHNIDTPLLMGLLARATLPGRVLVSTVHGEAKLDDMARTRMGRLRRRALRYGVDAHVALTDEMGRALRSIGVPAGRIHAISNGIDPADFRPATDEERRRERERLGLEATAVVFVAVGRLVAGKRVDLVLRAWARALPSDEAAATLLIVGDGPERGALEALAAELGVRRVRFEGEAADVRPYLRSADGFVAASDREGLSMALLEAMASGLAAVVTSLPGNQALVRDGENGLLVSPGDVPGLAERLRQCLVSPEKARALGRAARASLDAERTVRAAAARHRRLYRRVAGRSGSPAPGTSGRGAPARADGLPFTEQGR